MRRGQVNPNWCLCETRININNQCKKISHIDMKTYEFTRLSYIVFTIKHGKSGEDACWEESRLGPFWEQLVNKPPGKAVLLNKWHWHITRPPNVGIYLWDIELLSLQWIQVHATSAGSPLSSHWSSIPRTIKMRLRPKENMKNSMLCEGIPMCSTNRILQASQKKKPPPFTKPEAG